MSWWNPLKFLMPISLRHVVIPFSLLIIYCAWKAYVLYTPSPHDDNLPDQAMQVVVDHVQNNMPKK